MAKELTILINYATEEFRLSQKKNSSSGRRIGNFDKVIEFGPHSLDRRFRRMHSEVLSVRRGGGLWLWKPYIINKALETATFGDIIFYCDAGSYFVEDARPLLNIARFKQDVVPFSVGLVEGQYTKRDTFLLMNCDEAKYYDSSQRMGGFIVVKKSNDSLEFFRQYQYYVSDLRIVSDNDNMLGLPNYPSFIENRHDQSVFSLLSKKWGFACYRDPSRGPECHYSGIEKSSYKKIIHLHRERSYSYAKSFQERIFNKLRRALRR